MLTIAIITKNEETNISRCIESVNSLGPVVVADDGSSDNTVKSAKSLGAKVVRLPQVTSFAAKRNWLMGQIDSDWVLFIDADEQATPQLLQEIVQVTTSSPYKSFQIPRYDVLFGQPVKHGDNRVSIIRLVQPHSGSWIGAVHEIWRTNSPVGTLHNQLLHFPHPTIYEFLREINIYSSLRAQELHTQGHRVNVLEIVLYPVGKFLWLYVAKLGFLDGFRGAVSAVMMSFYSFLTRAKTWMLQNPGETFSA